MGGTRVLVGTRKGAFVLTSDERRTEWKVDGPHFPGWEIYHVTGSRLDPALVYVSQAGGWFGQVVHRSRDGGTTWETVGNDFAYDGVPGEHQTYDGTLVPWEFTRAWHLEPSWHEVDTVYAGVEDAALFVSHDAGDSWSELSGLRRHDTGPQWQPGGGGMCLHTILQHPTDPDRLVVAISAAGTFRSDDRGVSWRPINRGLSSGEIPDDDAEIGHCVHHVTAHPQRPDVLFMQKHWDVMRSDDAGDSWREVSGDLPSDFGFPIAVHAHEPDTVYGRADHQRLPALPARWAAAGLSQPRGRRAVGGPDRGAAAGALLRRRAARRDGRRRARVVRDLPRHHRRAGLRLERLRGLLGGDREGPPSRAVGGGADPAMSTSSDLTSSTITVALPAHLRAMAGTGAHVVVEVSGEVTQRSVLDAVEAAYPALLGTMRDRRTGRRRDFVRFFGCEEDLSHDDPDTELPAPIREGTEPLLVIGAMAGG